MVNLSFNMIVLLRMLAALVFGFGIGLEREITNKNAGLRTHILVCLGSCIFTILSIFAFPAVVAGSHGDPARISAQILTGIGFIGGGTVLRNGNSVSGLTTAATLWISAAIGMACGTGSIDLALAATVLSVGVLVLIRLFETNVLVHSSKNSKRMKIVAFCKDEESSTIHNYIMENFKYIHEISKKVENRENNISKITAIIDISGKKEVETLYQNFETLNGVESFSIQEYNE